MTPQAALALLIAGSVLACATPRLPEPEVSLTLIGTEAAEEIETIVEPHVGSAAGRIDVHGYIGLGQTGYDLVPTATAEQGVLDILITPRLPEEMMGLMVLTRYEYQLRVSNLAAGEYTVRIRYAVREGEEAAVAFEGRVRVP